jgi:hypothetical protein
MMVNYICTPSLIQARVAKLVDAPSSGGGVRKDVLVRIQSRALLLTAISFHLEKFIYYHPNSITKSEVFDDTAVWSGNLHGYAPTIQV